MDLPDSPTLENILNQMDAFREVYVWDLKKCDPFWISTSGKVFVFEYGHEKAAQLVYDFLELDIRIPPPAMYIQQHIHWVRGRKPCRRRNHEYVIFDCWLPMTGRQRKTILDHMDAFTDDRMFLRMVNIETGYGAATQDEWDARRMLEGGGGGRPGFLRGELDELP